MNASHSTVHTIRLRPLIRYLGGLLGFVAGLPSVIGCGYFLLHPGEIIANPGGAAFPLVLGPLIGVSTWRWFTIRGTIDETLVTLRGWWKTTTVERHRLAEVRQVYTRTGSIDSPSSTTWHYELFDGAGVSLGKVPAMLTACQHWDDFLSRLQRIASGDR